MEDFQGQTNTNKLYKIHFDQFSKSEKYESKLLCIVPGTVCTIVQT